VSGYPVSTRIQCRLMNRCFNLWSIYPGPRGPLFESHFEGGWIHKIKLTPSNIG
jgi:hypothetical protein